MSPGLKVAGFSEQPDWPKMGPSLLIAPCLILAIRTAEQTEQPPSFRWGLLNYIAGNTRPRSQPESIFTQNSLFHHEGDVFQHGPAFHFQYHRIAGPEA